MLWCNKSPDKVLLTPHVAPECSMPVQLPTKCEQVGLVAFIKLAAWDIDPCLHAVFLKLPILHIQVDPHVTSYHNIRAAPCSGQMK